MSDTANKKEAGVAGPQFTPGPWQTLSADERARIYQDASLRIHDIDWYRFHGVDPRDVSAKAIGGMA